MMPAIAVRTQPSSEPAQSSATQNWRERYRAALFEADRTGLPSRIAQAETAAMQRCRELRGTPSNDAVIEERQALDDALYALHALENCVKLNTMEAALEGTRQETKKAL